MSAVEQFRDAMRVHGLEPPGVIESGRLHRFPGAGRKNGDDAGWCKLFPDEGGGVFGDFSTGLDEVWQAKRAKPFTAAERETFRRKCEAERTARAEEEAQRHRDAAARAAEILQDASGDPASHPYAVAKGVPLGPRVKRGAWPQRGWDDALLIPVYGADGNVWTLEAINPDGGKDYLKGGRKRGGFHPLGKIRGAGRVLIGEGLATVAAVHAVDGSPAVAAMDAGNLLPAALSVRELAQDALLVFLADNDIRPDGSNPGLEAAMDAARSVGGVIAVPELDGRKCDFWDLWKERGADAVKAALEVASKPGGDWPEPVPLAVKTPCEPYPADALPDTIRRAVEEVQGFVKAPLPLIAGCALSAVSVAVQALYDVSRADKLNGPSGLFTLAIADSGERKTTCDGFFTKAIRDWEAEQREAIAPILERHESDMAAWNAEKEGILAAIRNAGKAGKDAGQLKDNLARLQQRKPEPPRIPRLILGDETPENLAWTLAKQWPSGGVVSSEAGVVFGAHGMGKDSIMRNLALLNVLWDGGELPIGRRTSESFTVRGTRLTVGLQIQEATLREFFGRSGALARGTGFLARFLVAWPESTQGTRFYSDPPDNWPRLHAFHNRITAILKTPVPIQEDGSLRPALLPLDSEAKAAWKLFYNAIESELLPSRELYDVRDVASKTAENAARLAALFQVFEHGTSAAVGLDAFERASRIAAWHLSESRRFFGELAWPVELANAAKLEAWLIQHCRQNRTAAVPKNTIRQCGPGAIRDKLKLEAALDELAELNRARQVKAGKETRVELNPALLAGEA